MNWFKKYWPIIVIVLVGLIFRFYNLTAISLWHDEAFSALLIKYPWSEMMYRIGLDVHPPMYYVFLRLWHSLLGDSLFALRGMSVFFGAGTILAVYGLVKRAFNTERAALIAAVLVAVNPFQVQYVTEARMYTMGAFFAILAAFFLVKALRRQREYYERLNMNIPHTPQATRLKRSFLFAYLWFVVSTSIIIYTHYYLLFTATALGLYALYFHWHTYKDHLRRYGWMILSFILIGVSFLPWLKIFLFQFRQVGGNYWIPPMDRWSIPNTLWTMLLGLPQAHKVLLVAVSLLTIYMLVRVIHKHSEHEKWLVILNFLAPFGGAILFLLLAKLRGQNSSVYLVRYFLFSCAFYTVLVALWLNSIKPKSLNRLLLALLCGINIFAIGYYWSDLKVSDKPGMAAAAKFLKANVEPNHKLFVGSSFEFFNYKYYNQTPVQPLLYTNNHTVEDLPHYAGTAILINDDLVLDFNKATKTGDTVWLLWTNAFGAGDKPPEVPKNWLKVDEHGYADVRPYVSTFIYVTEYKVN
jgi:mannosyltransferase